MTEGRTIAIGDVHGCSAALAALVRAIDPTALDTLVFLGDYIDRGPDSRGVLEKVIALAERSTVMPLLGNHEEMLLAGLEGQSELRYWLKANECRAFFRIIQAESPPLPNSSELQKGRIRKFWIFKDLQECDLSGLTTIDRGKLAA